MTDHIGSVDAVTHLTSLIKEVERRVDIRFDAVSAAVETAFREAQRATDKAELAAEKRIEGLNEFRGQLSDQAATFATKDSLEQLAERVSLMVDRTRDDLESLAKRIDLREGSSQGRASTHAAIIAGVGVVGTLLGIVAVVVVLIQP